MTTRQDFLEEFIAEVQGVGEDATTHGFKEFRGISGDFGISIETATHGNSIRQVVFCRGVIHQQHVPAIGTIVRKRARNRVERIDNRLVLEAELFPN